MRRGGGARKEAPRPRSVGRFTNARSERASASPNCSAGPSHRLQDSSFVRLAVLFYHWRRRRRRKCMIGRKKEGLGRRRRL